MQITADQKYNLRLLVKALRSGKYQQGSGNLVSAEGKHLYYCCLGVACAVLKFKTPTIRKEFHPGLGSEDQNTFLSEETAALFGFSAEQQEKLAEMNDNGKPFEQIADAIVEMFNLGSR